MDETYGTYIDDECFDIHDEHDTGHDPDDDTDDDTNDDTNDNTDDDTDDGPVYYQGSRGESLCT